MNLRCIAHKEFGYTIVVDMNTRQEVELDYELFPCDGKVHTEDGYDFEDKFFETDFFQDGWSIYEESDRLVVTCGGLYTLRNTFEFAAEMHIGKEPKPWYNQHGNKRSIFSGKK